MSCLSPKTNPTPSLFLSLKNPKCKLPAKCRVNDYPAVIHTCLLEHFGQKATAGEWQKFWTPQAASRHSKLRAIMENDGREFELCVCSRSCEFFFPLCALKAALKADFPSQLLEGQNLSTKLKICKPFQQLSKGRIPENADCVTVKALKEKFISSHTTIPLQKPDFLKQSILKFPHFTMEVVLGSRVLIIGKQTAVKNQRKQLHLSTHFLPVLKSL